MRLNDLAVGARWQATAQLLSVFRSRTGRNQPSNSRYIFGPSVWLRGLIKPPPGHGVAYIDWKQQEFAIAAVLSGDTAMQAAYLSGDPYLAFGKQAGLIPASGTKLTHQSERELCKQCVLATAVRDGKREPSASHSVNLRWWGGICCGRIARRMRQFWAWSDAALDTAMSTCSLHTVFGWHVHVGDSPNPRSLRNFVVQGNGAEMMRVAACLPTERGLEAAGVIHDAFLVCAPLDRLDEDIARMQRAMAGASQAVLGGFEIGTDVSITRFPDRFMDDRGRMMWRRVLDLLPPAPQRLQAIA